LGDREAEITLTEGRYHQVKRMFGSQGCTVLELDRIRLGGLELGNLARGSWIELPISDLKKF
jgi:16S rRNA pseudouridine516 synthase